MNYKDITLESTVAAVVALAVSTLFAWLTKASAAEGHIMFIGWLIMFQSRKGTA
jgi:hypothetical protein